jgi:glycopeptide antibiotics resistance protein
MRLRLLVPLVLATAAIAVITLLPLSGYRAHAHWDRVGWIPFADPRSRPWEMAANVLLFMPFGWTVARALGGARSAAILASGMALMLSVGVELAQVFAHGRFPSSTDVVMNFAGAALGAALLVREAGRGQRPVGAVAARWSRSRSHR